MGNIQNSKTVFTADLVFKNGAVYTVDKNRSWATAVAVHNKKIVYVGDDESVENFIGDNTETINLDRKMLLPGFFDSHAHPSSMVLSVVGVSLSNIESLQEYQKTVQEYAIKNPDLKAIYGYGWSNPIFPPIGPLKADLDAIISDRPAAMMSECGHAVWANSRALEICRITKETPDPPGGVIERDPETGEPAGTLRENAMDLVTNVLPPFTVAQTKTGLHNYMKMAAGEGITTVNDCMLMFPDAKGFLLGQGPYRYNIQTFEEMAQHNELTLRVRGALFTAPEQGVSQVQDIKTEIAKHNHPHFQINAAKIYVDGVVEGRTAFLLESYEGEPGFYGESLWPADVLNETCVAIDQENIQIHVHAIGDAATRITLDAFEFAQNTNTARDARHLITHLQIVSDADISRLADLDIIAVLQPVWFRNFYTESNLPFLGKERSDKQFPMQRFLDAGVKVASSSDFPVTVPSSPLLSIMTAITRSEEGVTDPNEVQWPEERTTLEEMIASYTINGAYAHFLENETGSIEVGKKADMVILDKNLFEIPPSKINNIKVLMTFFDGNEVYRDSTVHV
ncbi:MAG: amidohydrolase [Desulfobacterales bacterium]|nr:amidohydrolase [Desulfobacterales bacterium]